MTLLQFVIMTAAYLVFWITLRIAGWNPDLFGPEWWLTLGASLVPVSTALIIGRVSKW
jgi:hypothetical protein